MYSMDRITDDSDPSGNHQKQRRRHFPPGFDDPPPGYSPSSQPPPPPPPPAVKLYVGRIPIGTTEDQIRGVFGEFGNVLEFVPLKSKRNGEPRDCCFVKYATYEEADGAIKALNDRYVFPGAFNCPPIKVRYADGGIVQHKLYVNGLHRQASEAEIAQIFTPYGHVEEVFIIRNQSDMRQTRGSAFIQFSLREMAVNAIAALHGNYTMWGCDVPLIVRFADPKKPRVLGSRGTPTFTDQVHGFPCDSHSSPNKRCKPLMPHASNSFDSGFHSSSSSPYAPFPNEEPADSVDCDWSEHICPFDGHPYYYNCVTSESRWEKPDEYAAYERELLKLEHPHQHTPHLEVLSPAVVAQF